MFSGSVVAQPVENKAAMATASKKSECNFFTG